MSVRKFAMAAAVCAVIMSWSGRSMADSETDATQADYIADDNTDIGNPCGYISLAGTWYAFPISATGKNANLLENIKLVKTSLAKTSLRYNGTVSCYQGTFPLIKTMYIY